MSFIESFISQRSSIISTGLWVNYEYLVKYGYHASDESTWKAGDLVTMLELGVDGHEEIDGHTHYNIGCRLQCASSPPLAWYTKKRLAHLRDCFNVVTAGMGASYERFFNGAPFALRGGPRGTTSRLDQWCKALAFAINDKGCSPKLVQSVLEFLEVPELLLPFANNCRTLSLEKQTEFSWRLSGLHVDDVLRMGLESLDSQWIDDECLLQEEQRQSLSSPEAILGLLTGASAFNCLRFDNIAAVLGDLELLSARQLLRLRVRLLQHPNEHTSFLSSLDVLMFQRLAVHAMDTSTSAESADPKALHLLGVELVLFVAATDTFEAREKDLFPLFWVCHLGMDCNYFDAKRCKCFRDFPKDVSVLQAEMKSEADPKYHGRRWLFEWVIQRISDENDLATFAKQSHASLISAKLITNQSGDIPLVSEEAVERDKAVSVKLVVGRDLTEATEDVTYVLASIQTPSNMNESCQPQPSDLVCVLDVSGSMNTEAKIQGSGGATESHGLSLLDVAKHGVRTIINTLSALDRVAIVSFNHISVVVLPLTKMDTDGQLRAEAALDTLMAGGGTNIWEGLKNGLDVLCEEQNTKGRFGHIMLLTDGESNNRETIRPNLINYKETSARERLPGTINTFGFGYQLDSALLGDLAEIGSGSYSFIPDAGFVGTAFVNTLSNLLVTMAREVYLTLSVESDAEIVDNQIMGGYQVKVLSDSIRINLGTLQYGQTKDIIVPMKIVDTTNSFLFAQVQYETRCGCLETTQCTETDGKEFQNEIVEIQRCRCLFADILPKAVAVALKGPLDDSCQEALALLDGVICGVKKSIVKDNDVVLALLEDMQGQSTEALSKGEWFAKWGRHYLPSVMFAHRLQQCNNFKDPGVQVYGGELFSDIRDRADEEFNQLPPPKPSIQARRSVSVTAPTSMAAYNDRYAG